MAIPATVYGAGSSTVKNVLGIKFSFPLSSKVKYECYDNTETFPAVGNLTTTANAIFGHWGTSKSMIGLIDTTGGGAPVTNWFPTLMANTATMNRMKGLTRYVTQHGPDVAANGSICWNMQISVPATTKTITDVMSFDLLVRYTFVSTIPVLTWRYWETSSTKVTMTPGTHGLVHTRDDITAPPYLANIPVSGREKTKDIWVVSSLT